MVQMHLLLGDEAEVFLSAFLSWRHELDKLVELMEVLDFLVVVDTGISLEMYGGEDGFYWGEAQARPEELGLDDDFVSKRPLVSFAAAEDIGGHLADNLERWAA